MKKEDQKPSIMVLVSVPIKMLEFIDKRREKFGFTRPQVILNYLAMAMEDEERIGKMNEYITKKMKEENSNS